jgi:hypothetical protein
MTELIKIQNELKVPKGNLNKFGNYKYRSAEDILEAVKPILFKHGGLLTLTDNIEAIGNKLFLKATASLWVGEANIFVYGFAELAEHKGMSAEQTTGTASSYARKYALNGLFLIDETEQDADNDNKKVEVKPMTEPPKHFSATATQLPPLDDKRFLKMLEAIAKGDTMIVKVAMQNYTLLKEQKDELEKQIELKDKK